MPKVRTAKRGKVQSRETICIVVGARPVEWHRRIVRDRRTSKLVEIDIHELGPKVEEDPGVPYVFKRGEIVDADHPAVLQSEHAFKALDDEAA